MQQKKHLIVIGGATATGKTAAAIHLAKYFKTEILSADSRQFYQEMNIGTAKPTALELEAAPHHFIGTRSVEQDYSVGDYERDAIDLLNRLFQKKDTLILAGGSGLFIKAVCEGLDKFPEVSEQVSQELQHQFESEGIESLQAELQQLDPAYASTVDLQNPMRLMRALGVCRASGQPFSSFRKGEKAERGFTPIYLRMEMERQELYERINARVDKMMVNGLLAEAEKLFPSRHLNALQTVGYQEFFEYFAGNTSLEEAIELVKRNSRRYAKRQMTWLRKEEHWKSFPPSNHKEMIAFIEGKMST